MAFKNEYVYYQAKNFKTGATVNVDKALRDGGNVAGLVGKSLTEVDAVNSPGLYQLIITPAEITAGGGSGTWQFRISEGGSTPADAVVRKILEYDPEDLETHLTTIEGKIDTVDGVVDDILVDTADMQPRVVSIETITQDTNDEVKSGAHGLSQLKTLIDAVQSTVDNITNVTRFSASVPSSSIIPGTGNNDLRVQMQLTDTDGNLEDPDTNQIEVSAYDESGNDVTASVLIFGTQVDNGGGKVDAVRDSQGQYRHDYRIADTRSEQQITFLYEYVENSAPLAATRVTQLVADALAAGFALESTAQDILTDTADMQPKVSDIQTKINDASYGLAALKTLIDTIDGEVGSILTDVQSGVFGLSAIKTAIDSKASQLSVDGLVTDVGEVKGAGFDTATDSLKAIADRQFTGGRAI